MQLSPQNRQQLGQLYRALADKVLMPGDVNYLPALHQQGGVDVMAELATEIEFQDGGSVGVFTGQRGTGKSTELRRLEAMLKDAGCSVVFVDMSEYMFMYKPVEVSDFLVSLCGAFSDAIEKLCGGWGPGQTGYWERFQNFLNSKVELKELGASLSGVDIKATLRTDLLFKQRLQDGARSHVVQLIQDAHAFFADAVKQLRIQQGDLQRKVVLIVDSVERLRGDGSEANEMLVYESVRTLFFGHAESLRLHKERVTPAPLRTAAMCATCHRAFLDESTGNAHFFAGADDPTPWQRSVYAGSLLARVDEPVEQADCKGCHMPKEDAPLGDVSTKEGKIASHRFLGGHSWLAAMLGDGARDLGLVGLGGGGGEREADFGKAQLEQPIAAARLAVIVPLGRGPREDLDLAIVEAEAAIDRGDLRLDGSLVRQQEPGLAALDDGGCDRRAVDVGQ